MKKHAIIFSIILAITVLCVLFLNMPIFSFETNFLIKHISFCTTIFLSIASYLAMRNYSKQIAVFGIILLVFIYSIFAWAIEIGSAEFTRIAIILTQTAIIIFGVICGIITKEKTKNRIKQEVSRYVADQVWDCLDEATSHTTRGTKEVLTIMFIDIRGFTTISEQHSAEEVTEILNNYFKEIIPVIKKHNGIINKFIGDALLAVFTGESPDVHAKNAVRAGREILNKLKNSRMIQEAEGKDKITAGIGINTGEVFVGNIGTEDRCEYTVIGDTVNIASRTESANRLYKTEFLIAENTYKYVKNIADVIKISDVELKGKREKVNVYEVLRVSEND